MKTLPFEGRFVLDTEACPRCAGSGQYAHPTPALPADCFNCRGLGRKPTSEALQLFYQVCELLGKPIAQREREGRLEPKHLETIWARDVRAGMCVRMQAPGPARDWPVPVQAVEVLEASNLRIRFEDGTTKAIPEFTLLQRVLTDEEIANAQSFMAGRLGHGAVDAEYILRFE